MILIFVVRIGGSRIAVLSLISQSTGQIKRSPLSSGVSPTSANKNGRVKGSAGYSQKKKKKKIGEKSQEGKNFNVPLRTEDMWVKSHITHSNGNTLSQTLYNY